MTPLPFQIRRSDAEVHGTCLYRFELINTANGNRVCVARGESGTPPQWIVNAARRYNAEHVKAMAIHHRVTP
jgi:hypothetical protein